jgi:hemerythrin-like domain-containing protein
MKNSAAQDVLALLKQDHAKVKELLSQLEETTTRGVKRRQELLGKIADEVRLHAHVEETIFYPAFRESGSTHEDEKMFLEAAEEHRLVHEMLPEIEDTDPATELFSARAKVLKDLIEHHAEEEEKEMFKRAKELMPIEERRALAERIEERKQAVQEEGIPLKPVGAARNGGRGKADRD